MKSLRCKVCGEEILARELLQDKDGDFIFCPTCEGTKFIVIGTENEEIDTLYIEEEEGNQALIIALAEEFGCYPKDVGEGYDNEYNIDGTDYLVLTGSEADDKVAEYIEDTLWAFSSNFLASVTGVDESVFIAIQDNGNCESNNEAIQSILDATNTSMSEVAQEAISWDGRGHYLSQYDGEEIEVYVDGKYYYCYRI